MERLLETENEIYAKKLGPTLAVSFNFGTDAFWNKLGNQFLQIAAGCLSLHDLKHLSSDFLNLRRLSIARLADLSMGSSGKGNAKQTHRVAILCLHFHHSFNQRSAI